MSLPSYMSTLGSLKPSQAVVTSVPAADWAESDSDSPSFVANKPTAMRSPAALSFGQKTYDGFAAATVTAADLGALTAHQDISGKVDSSALFSGGKVKPELLPSYVDDVLEYPSLAGFPSAGEAGKIYVAKDTNKTYRWSGTQYVEISPAPTVDSSLSPNSENPVQNKVVTAALDNKITPGTVEPQSNRLLSLLALVKQSGITLPESVYTTYGVDGLLALKANASDVTAALALKADASSLPYALVDVTPTAGAPFVLAACFPIVYTISGQTTTITDADAGGLRISFENNIYGIYHNELGLFFMDSYGVYVELDNVEIESLTFNGTAPTASVTQVLGFTPTYALADRTMNYIVLDTLPENGIALAFPDATAGKVRDFLVRLEIPAGDAPQIAYPSDVKFGNGAGEFPEINTTDTTGATAETILMFTETAPYVANATPAKFLVKGEAWKEVS